MNIWMIGENSMKHHPQPPPKKKKKNLQSLKYGRYY